MALVPMPELLSRARDGGYAVGYFEAWDSYSLEAVIAAAEAEHAPVIIGFGCMLLDQAWLERGGIELFGAIGRPMAESCGVPVSLLLNEAHTIEHALRGIDAGFNAVMICDSDTDRNARLVAAAHAAGVAVEAELGQLPDGGPDGRIDSSRAELTDPEQAAAFVVATGVDALAVSFGNVHTLEGAPATVDLERLAAVHARVEVPLVAHGGTAFPAEAVPGAIQRGVAKFNVGTVLKRTYLDLLREATAAVSARDSPHDLVGSHNDRDLLAAGKAGITEVVRALIRRFGASGHAADWNVVGAREKALLSLDSKGG
ncbi:MAG TPA: class II fructose-bisphosphate aldolase [Solirubrobacteraceae bacterium]|nr:class II fructose-bisphosphate aldolase [Solirubrobacteraceae bacterium]